MTQIIGTLTDVGATPGPGTLRIAAVDVRPDEKGQRTITTQWHSYPIDSKGKFRIPDAVPGPAQIVIESTDISERIKVVIPSTSQTVRLETLLPDDYEWPAPVIGEAQQAMRDAIAEATKATQAATQAGTHAERAGESAASASSAAEFAARDAKDAAVSAKSAVSSASGATQSAGKAAASASQAGSSASDAKASATAASTSASQAEASADRAGRIASSTSWSGDRLTVNGRTSPPLTGPRGPMGRVEDHAHPISEVNGLDVQLDRYENQLNYYVEMLKSMSAQSRELQDDVVALQTDLVSVRAELEAVRARPALWSGSGKPPSSIPGARKGDWWLDESSMDLYRITGV